QNDVLDVAFVFDEADAADQLLLAAAFEVCPSDVRVVVRKGIHNLTNRESVRAEPSGIDENFVLLLFAAETVDLDHAGDGAKLRLDVPIENRPEIAKRVLVLPGHVVDRELVDF